MSGAQRQNNQTHDAMKLMMLHIRPPPLPRTFVVHDNRIVFRFASSPTSRSCFRSPKNESITKNHETFFRLRALWRFHFVVSEAGKVHIHVELLQYIIKGKTFLRVNNFPAFPLFLYVFSLPAARIYQ